MRRLPFCAILLLLAGSVVAVVVVRTSADGPRPAVVADDNPFGDSGNAPPAKAKSTAAGSTPAQADESDDEKPPGLRPFPPGPSSKPLPNGPVLRPAVPARVAAPLPGHIITPEMAMSPEPLPVVDALSEGERAAYVKINAALETKTTLDFEKTPLANVADELKKRHGVEIQLDLAALKEAGVEPSTPVTEHVANVTLRAALRRMLDKLQLRCAVHDEVLLVTSQQRAASDDFMLTRIYPVKDLVLVRNENDEIQADCETLVDLIKETVAPRSWNENGGQGIVISYALQDRCLLVVNQTQEVHEGVLGFLTALRRFGNPAPKDIKELRLPKLRRAELPNYCPPNSQSPAHAAQSPGTGATTASSSAQTSAVLSQVAAPYLPHGFARCVRILTPEMAAAPEPLSLTDADVTSAEAKINAALESPTEIACDNMPLRQLVEQLKKRHKIEIQLDLPALKEAGVDPGSPVTRHVADVSLRAALRLVLEGLQLDYAVQDGVLLITSAPRAESEEFLLTRIYPVEDLLLKNRKGEIEVDFEPLLDLITLTISTKSWEESGGSGMIPSYQFQDRCLLVVTQTPHVHEQISQLFGALRRCGGNDGKKPIDHRLPR